MSDTPILRRPFPAPPAAGGAWWFNSYIGSMLLMLFLLYSAQILSITRLWRNKIFFDKLCINQTDAATQLACVRAIPGILMRTKNIVCVIDSQYFTRLWCMLEKRN